jgi:hypothetical protein
VVAAIAAAILYGGWWARLAALLDFALLAFVGDIFAGLSHLDVAAVGHLTAITTGAVAAAALMTWSRRERQPASAATATAASDGDRLGLRAAERAAHRRPPA